MSNNLGFGSSVPISPFLGKSNLLRNAKLCNINNQAVVIVDSGNIKKTNKLVSLNIDFPNAKNYIKIRGKYYQVFQTRRNNSQTYFYIDYPIILTKCLNLGTIENIITNQKEKPNNIPKNQYDPSIPFVKNTTLDPIPGNHVPLRPLPPLIGFMGNWGI